MFSIVDCPNKSYPVGHLRTGPIVYVHSLSLTHTHFASHTLQNFVCHLNVRHHILVFSTITPAHHNHFSCFFIVVTDAAAADAVCHCTLGQLVQMRVDYSICSVEKQSIRKHANELEVMVLSQIHITLTQHTQNTNASNTSSIK